MTTLISAYILTVIFLYIYFLSSSSSYFGAGVLQTMLLPFKLGLGGPFGSGQQYMSWISLTDTLRAVHFLISNRDRIDFGGRSPQPVNFVSPNPVTNAEFTKTLGKLLWRPTWFWVPEFVCNWLGGQFARETVLCSVRARPDFLSGLGFEFEYPTLEECLAHCLTNK